MILQYSFFILNTLFIFLIGCFKKPAKGKLDKSKQAKPKQSPVPKNTVLPKTSAVVSSASRTNSSRKTDSSRVADSNSIESGLVEKEKPGKNKKDERMEENRKKMEKGTKSDKELFELQPTQFEDPASIRVVATTPVSLAKTPTKKESLKNQKSVQKTLKDCDEMAVTPSARLATVERSDFDDYLNNLGESKGVGSKRHTMSQGSKEKH